MNVGDIKRRASNLLGDDAMLVFETADLLDMINDAQMDICRKTGFLTGTDNFDGVKGTEKYDLQASCIEVKRVTWQGSRLIRTTWQELDMIDPARNTTQGTPTKFYVDGDQIGLYPVPSTTTTLAVSVQYSRCPIALSSDTQTPELPLAFHEDIVTRVVARGHEQVEDFQASQAKATEYNQSITLTQQQLMDGTEETYSYIRDTEGPYT
jgi:hypothetical protein